MPIAATVLFAREDFSIPGAPDPVLRGTNGAAAERRFFDLLQGSRPDVVLLDLSRANGAAVETILKIRRKSPTPILVVCDVSHPSADDYKSAGAADCIPAPVDILRLN